MNNFSRLVCEKNSCNGCGACIATCPKKAISISEDFCTVNAVINEKLCINCNVCHSTCPVNNSIIGKNPISWIQGWSKRENIRANASSGGAAGEIMTSFIENGGVVFGFVYKDNKFMFSMIDTPDDVAQLQGSKYIKSNPVDVYQKIKEKLKLEMKVLFIGLPCQSAGLQSFLPEPLKKNLYTIDLICHGTPTNLIFELFLQGYTNKKINDIKFRFENDYGIYLNNDRLKKNGLVDHYTYAFLKGLSCSENCYQCKYASTKRVSDLTLGDAWGSSLSQHEIRKGISLILCQSDKGNELLSISNLHIEPINPEIAIKNNKQLINPMKNEKHTKFKHHIENGLAFNKAVFLCYPKVFLKQNIKRILIDIKCIGRRK